MKKKLIQILQWIRNIFLLLIVLSLLLVILYKYVPVFYTSSMFSYSLRHIHQKESKKMEHDWIPLKNISQNMIQAAIVSEDDLFLVHNGFNFKPPDKTLVEFPTISQQMVRSVFLWEKRSWLRETLETYFTVLVEFVWGKERIIEIYLNSMEFAEGVFGVQAISMDVFEKPAELLTKEEAALIATVISDPESLSLKSPSAYMLRKQAKIMSLMDKMIPVEFGSKQNIQKDE